MGFIQQKLNRDEPYGGVFAGSGEQHDQDRQCAFYQNGLYFDAQGDLLVDHPYNAALIAKRSALAATPRLTAATPQVGDPEVIRELGTRSDEEVYQMAVNLITYMQGEGQTVDFEPVETDRDASVDFIIKHTVSA